MDDKNVIDYFTAKVGVKCDIRIEVLFSAFSLSAVFLEGDLTSDLGWLLKA